MIKKVIFGSLILSVTFFAAENSFAQRMPCLLGVGDCPVSDQGTGTRYFNGAQAQEILKFINYGSRYLLVLSRYQDPNSNCVAEDRAWVSSITANDGNTIAVKVSPARKVLLCNGNLTAQQVNQAEAWIQYSRKMIYDWQVYQGKVTSDPAEYQRAAAWINYFTQYINNAQKQVATSAP